MDDLALPKASSSPRVLSPITFVVFGVVLVTLSLAIFAFTTRCPCKAKKAVSFVEPVQKVAADTAKPFADEEAAASLKSTVYVLSWDGAGAPSEGLRVHFLQSDAPHGTFGCEARSLFGAQGRVRVTLPKAAYIVRAVFADGTQGIVQDVPDGGLVTLTDGAVRGEVLREPVAAADVQAGVCTRDA